MPRTPKTQLFIDAALPGLGLEYSLQLYNLVPDQLAERGELCITYELLLKLNGATDPACQLAEVLPTDLFSPEGGAALYGGPQDEATGRLQIAGCQFPLARQAPRSGSTCIPRWQQSYACSSAQRTAPSWPPCTTRSPCLSLR